MKKVKFFSQPLILHKKLRHIIDISAKNIYTTTGKAKLNATAKTTMADVKDLTVEFTDATLTWDGENWNQVNK